MKNRILEGDASSISKQINVEELVTEFLDKERRKAMRGTFVRVKNPFSLVNERYARSLAHQVVQNVETKRVVLKRAIRDTENITEKQYVSLLRDLIFNRLLPNLRYHTDCARLELSPFAAAQNIAIAGVKQIENVLNLGIDVVYKDNIKVLKDEIFTEVEMAKAKFASATSSPSEWQCSEATRLAEIISRVIKEVEEKSKTE